jgi:uncharacterized C2H2 Zn-finger protein
MPLRCPRCGKLYVWAEQRQQCCFCKYKAPAGYVLTDSGLKQVELAESDSSNRTGKITTPCPACGKTGRAPREYAGKLVKCGKCGQSFRLPPVPSAADGSSPAGAELT